MYIEYRTLRNDIRTTELSCFSKKIIVLFSLIKPMTHSLVKCRGRNNIGQIKCLLHRHYSLPNYFRFTNHILSSNSVIKKQSCVVTVVLNFYYKWLRKNGGIKWCIKKKQCITYIPLFLSTKMYHKKVM